ncbi:MAG: alpha/beta hydrolase [Hungatella hathewayi]|nr:alpha/beta hydrolase [Hungatella hathewayi]
MALTEMERKELQSVLDRTGAHREAGKKEKVVPDDYLAYGNLVTRETVLVEVPSVNVPVECYITKAKDRQPGCPVHVNMHGGGFVFLQDEDDDRYCARLAAEIHGIVVDINYASSLKHPYPVALEQCCEVMRWTFKQCEAWEADAGRVSMGGHSAGGCLVAAISLKVAASQDFQVCLQILDYAANDNYVSLLQENAERSQAFSLLYADGDKELLKNPYVSPAYATVEMMANQPRTLIINAENCPFCDVNEQYGLRLVSAGAEVKMRRFKNSRHGFTVRMVDEWNEAQNLIIREILDAGKPSR